MKTLNTLQMSLKLAFKIQQITLAQKILIEY